jgi:hypothetical protein
MTNVDPQTGPGPQGPSPPKRPGFASTGAYFQGLADKARDEDQRQRWLEVAGFYRSLAGIIPAMPKDYNHNGRVPPLTRAERWRARAEECQALADCTTNLICRNQLIELAEGYDRMALAAE